jgi:PPOX class probable F420-dependent enzyme
MAKAFDPNDPDLAEPLRLLRERIIAWFTTVDAEGRPHAVPVWFQWHDGRVLVFSEEKTAKVRHVRRGSPVLVHLETGAFGNEVVILTGTAHVSERTSAEWLAEFRDAYADKYAEAIAEYGQSLDEIMATFSTTLVFTPDEVLAW